MLPLSRSKFNRPQTPLTSRNQLQLALNAHLQALAFLKKNGQALGDAMILYGLNSLVQHLQMANEIEAAINIHERTGK